MNSDTGLVRLAVGLAHAMPGGRIEITLDDGTRICAAHGAPSMTPCDLRAMAITNECTLWGDAIDRVRDMHVGGTDIADLGAGLYGRRRPDGASERWFATLLAPRSVSEIIESCPLEFTDAVEASLRPDPELGVTVAVLSSETVYGDACGGQTALDEAARWVSSSCYVQEVIQTTRVR